MSLSKQTPTFADKLYVCIALILVATACISVVSALSPLEGRGKRYTIFRYTSQICGDNFLQIGEECDDGNLVPGDGCNFCKLEYCSESDRGPDFYQKGDVTFRTGGTTEDSCLCDSPTGLVPCSEGTYIAEWTCDRFGDPTIVNEPVPQECPFGCTNGQCLVNPQEQVIFASGRKSEDIEFDFRTESTFIPKYEMTVNAVEPEVQCTGPCIYHVAILKRLKPLAEAVEDATARHGISGRLPRDVSLKHGEQYSIFQHVWSDFPINISTMGNVTRGWKNGEARSVYGKSEQQYFTERGPIAHTLLGACDECAEVTLHRAALNPILHRAAIRRATRSD